MELGTCSICQENRGTRKPIGSMIHIGNTDNKSLPVFACTECDGGATKIAASND